MMSHKKLLGIARELAASVAGRSRFGRKFRRGDRTKRALAGLRYPPMIDQMCDTAADLLPIWMRSMLVGRPDSALGTSRPNKACPMSGMRGLNNGLRIEPRLFLAGSSLTAFGCESRKADIGGRFESRGAEVAIDVAEID